MRSSTNSNTSHSGQKPSLGSSSKSSGQVRRNNNRPLGIGSSNGSGRVRRNNNKELGIGSSSNGNGQVRRNKSGRNNSYHHYKPVQMKSKTIDCGDCEEDDVEFLLTQIKQTEEDPRFTTMVWKDLLSRPRSFQTQNSHSLDLKLNIISGKGLAACDSNIFGKDTTSDPYVIADVVLIGEDGKSQEILPIGKTQIIHKTLNPTWNETLAISIPELSSNNLNYIIRLTIMDHDTVGDDDCMGVVEIPMNVIVGNVHKKGEWYEVPEDSAKKACGSIKVGIDTSSTPHGLLPTLEALIFAKDRDWKNIVFEDQVNIDTLDVFFQQKSFVIGSLEKRIISEDQRIKRENERKLLKSSIKKPPLEPWCNLPTVLFWKINITIPEGIQVDELMDVLLTVKNDIHVLDMRLNGGLPSPSSLVKKVAWEVDLDKPVQSNPLLKSFFVEVDFGWKNDGYVPTPYKKFINVLLCHFKEAKRGIRRELEASGRTWSSRRSSLPHSFHSSSRTKDTTTGNTSSTDSSSKRMDPSMMRVKHIKQELDSYGVSYDDVVEKDALVEKLIKAREANNHNSNKNRGSNSSGKKKKKTTKRSKSMDGPPPSNAHVTAAVKTTVATVAAAVPGPSRRRRRSQESLPDLAAIPDTVEVERKSPAEISSETNKKNSTTTKLDDSPRSVSERKDSVTAGVTTTKAATPIEDPISVSSRRSSSLPPVVEVSSSASSTKEKPKRKSSLSSAFKKYVSSNKRGSGGGGGGGPKRSSTSESAPSSTNGGGGEQHASGWKQAVDPASGDIYYYNKKTKATTWDKPPEMEA